MNATIAPRLLSRADTLKGWRVEWQVPEKLAIWPGHFPEQFLVPGVLQLEWILREAEARAGHPIFLHQIDRLKFKQPIFPGDRITLECNLHAPKTNAAATDLDLRIEVSARNQLATTARLLASAETPSGALNEEPSSFPDPSPLHSTNHSWPSPSELLPHRAPMLWLDRVLSHAGEETRCLARTADLELFLNAAGEAGAWVAIEWMAQCVAAHDGVGRHQKGLPIRPGMLLGTKRLALSSEPFDQIETVQITARRIFGGETGMVSYDCIVEEPTSGRRRAAARLSCMVGTPGTPLVSTSGAPSAQSPSKTGNEIA